MLLVVIFDSSHSLLTAYERWPHTQIWWHMRKDVSEDVFLYLLHPPNIQDRLFCVYPIKSFISDLAGKYINFFSPCLISLSKDKNRFRCCSVVIWFNIDLMCKMIKCIFPIFPLFRAKDVPPEVLRQREVKWLDMLGHWDKWMIKRYNKVSTKC